MSRYRYQLKGAPFSKKVLATSRESSNELPAAALLGNLQKKLEEKRVIASGMLLFATDRSNSEGPETISRFAFGNEISLKVPRSFQLQEHHSMCGLC